MLIKKKVIIIVFGIVSIAFRIQHKILFINSIIKVFEILPKTGFYYCTASTFLGSEPLIIFKKLTVRIRNRNMYFIQKFRFLLL